MFANVGVGSSIFAYIVGIKNTTDFHNKRKIIGRLKPIIVSIKPRIMFVKYINSAKFDIEFYTRLKTADLLNIGKKTCDIDSFNGFSCCIIQRCRKLT